jgi:hypothetical protein
MASLIKCRKCGGPHVTLKCGKEKQDLNIILETTFAPPVSTHTHVHQKTHIIDKRKIVVVKLDNLPLDITINELNDLLNEWGKIGRINLNNATEYKMAFIDFYYKDEAEYFIKAIDRTPFDNLIINAKILD